MGLAATGITVAVGCNINKLEYKLKKKIEAIRYEICCNINKLEYKSNFYYQYNTVSVVVI